MMMQKMYEEVCMYYGSVDDEMLGLSLAAQHPSRSLYKHGLSRASRFYR